MNKLTNADLEKLIFALTRVMILDNFETRLELREDLFVLLNQLRDRLEDQTCAHVWRYVNSTQDICTLCGERTSK